ncbi:MAG: PD-(D/E)XK nuclease family protein [Bacilli bacterium]|nr:PD-(D/E)XK nuclease family protein [Bacilli bacterium]
MNLTNYNLVVTSNSNKKRILRKLSEEKELLNVKFMSLDELLCSLSFSFDQKSIYHIMKEYNIKYDNALVYLNNLKYINDKLDNPKMNKLKEIKELVKDDLIYDNEFINYIKNKRIGIYGYDYINNYQRGILKDYDYEIIDNPKDNYDHKIYAFNKVENEVVFVLSSINKLINDGVDINKIKLINVSDDYLFSLKYLSSLFNIRINFKSDRSIFETLEFNSLLIKYINEEELICENKTILDSFIRIINKCNFIDDKMDRINMIHSEAKNTYTDSDTYDNAVDIINLSELNDDEYGFFLGFTEELAYTKYKDDDYFSDKEKTILGIETSDEINKINKDNLINNIKSKKNLTISYSLSSSFNVYYPSSLIDELNYEVIKDSIYDYKCSNLYNVLLLYKDIDRYIKYGEKSNELITLYSNYEEYYKDGFDNSYKKIDSNKIINSFTKGLNLSYSSMNEFYECKFKYYLDNVLKIREDEETSAIEIGKLFHEVLSKMNNKDFDFDKEYDEISKSIIYTNKDKFFIKKLKGELKFIIDTINKQYKYMSFDKSLEEQRVEVNLDKNIKITFKGFIDKALYKEDNDKTIMIIIDYKTGNTELDLSKCYYGLNLQLPVYLYLSDNLKDIKNVEVLGFYIQKILHGIPAYDKNKSIDEIKQNNLKLQGYTTSNMDKIPLVDSSFNKSEIIYGMSTKKDGDLSANAKVLDDTEMNNLKELVKDKIDNMINDILSSSFEIDPKKIDYKDVSCTYCKYKDVCFRKEKDYKILDKKDYKEFLGGSNE